MKRSLLIAVLLAPLISNVAAASSPTRDAVEHQHPQVRLHVEDGQLNSGAEPGFLLTVEGWEPNGHDVPPLYVR